MLIEVDSLTFNESFPIDPHPFISEKFIELNKRKVEKIVRLTPEDRKPVMGFIAGIKERVLQSPFSAPFGGFHFRKDNTYISEIDIFIQSLKEYVKKTKLLGVDITLPPDIYHKTFNAKCISALVRGGFQISLLDITNWIDLKNFNGAFTQKNTKKYYRQAVRNKLQFEIVSNPEEQLPLYKVILENRKRFGRPIYMTFEDLKEVEKLWPVEYFKVVGKNKELLASGIFYQSHPTISFGLFWGDLEEARPLRAMDYLIFNIIEYYKNLGFDFIDLGISTEAGTPNEGLLRFKESHEATSSIKYKFSWRA